MINCCPIVVGMTGKNLMKMNNDNNNDIDGVTSKRNQIDHDHNGSQ